MSPPGIPRLAAGLSLLPWLQWYSLPFTEVFCLPCTLYNSYHHAIGNNLNLAVLVAFRGFNAKSVYIAPQQPEQCSEAQVREDQLVIFSPGWFRLPASCLATPAFLVIAGGSEKTSVYSIQVCVYSEGKINQSEHCCLPCNYSWHQLRDQIVDFFKQSLEKTTDLEASHRMMMTEKVVNKGSLLQARSHTEVREIQQCLAIFLLQQSLQIFNSEWGKLTSGVWNSGEGITKRCEVCSWWEGSLIGDDRPNVWKVDNIIKDF